MINKRNCIVANTFLVFWFFLDMFGFRVGNFILVESAWRDIDGTWYLIYLALFALFFAKEKYGKYPLTIFLSLWLAIQFSSHWYYTIFGATTQKITSYNKFFENTYHIIPPLNSIIIPDLYHIILHIFILFALGCMIVFCVKNRKID